MRQLNRFRWAGVAALSAAAVAVLLTGHGKQQTKSRPTTQITTPAATAPPAAGDKTKAQPIPKRHKRQLGLSRTAVAFLQAYYRLLPGDTAAVRRRRIDPFVTSVLLGKLAFGNNHAAGTKLQAAVDTTEMVVRQKGGLATVKVPVVIFVERSNGRSSQSYITLPTRSSWAYRSGRWVAVSFN